jgi:hypothetical protein
MVPEYFHRRFPGSVGLTSKPSTFSIAHHTPFGARKDRERGAQTTCIPDAFSISTVCMNFPLSEFTFVSLLSPILYMVCVCPYIQYAGRPRVLLISGLNMHCKTSVHYLCLFVPHDFSRAIYQTAAAPTAVEAGVCNSAYAPAYFRGWMEYMLPYNKCLARFRVLKRHVKRTINYYIISAFISKSWN